MIDLKGFKGVAFLRNTASSIPPRETTRVYFYCIVHDIPFLFLNGDTICPEDYVPCGTVEWCIASLNHNVTPDYYPDWCSNYLYRQVWESDTWITGKKLFVKPADRYKRFTGFITSGKNSDKKEGPFIWSDVVDFVNEWRYYISAGNVLCSGWYWGDEVLTPDPPELPIIIPSTYYGALDFGMLSTGELALVESQHPFACGWYGRDDEAYIQWLIDGWSYMLQLKENK